MLIENASIIVNSLLIFKLILFMLSVFLMVALHVSFHFLGSHLLSFSENVFVVKTNRNFIEKLHVLKNVQKGKLSGLNVQKLRTKH